MYILLENQQQYNKSLIDKNLIYVNHLFKILDLK